MELANRLRSHGMILIYGTGRIGKRFYYMLKDRNIDIVKAYIVERVENGPDFIDTIPVRNYREFLRGNEKIVIALPDKKEAAKVRCTLLEEKVAEDRIILWSSLEVQARALMEIFNRPFNSGAYWEERYLHGGNSGSGSYNKLAEFKAEIINEFIERNNIGKVLEWGCGDGNQLRLGRYPNYIGFDVSKKAIELCIGIFSGDDTKRFIWCGGKNFRNEESGELAMSLDVIFHLVEDNVYEEYMRRLFLSSERYVCIYSSNFEKQTAAHVKNRRFTCWIEDNLSGQWELVKFVKNRYPYLEEKSDETSRSDFYFYKKIE